MSLLQRAEIDERNRKEANNKAVESLLNCYKALNPDNLFMDRSKIIAKLEDYIAIMKRVNDYNKITTQTCTTAIHNRMEDIFNHTKNYVEKELDQLIEAFKTNDSFDHSIEHTPYLANSTNLLFLVVTLIASIDPDHKNFNLLCGGEVDNVLNPRTSPILHGTPLSPNFNISGVGIDVSKFPFLYFDNMTDSHELLVPTVGYLYAGNRCDRADYKLKPYKNHDCSSSLVEWVGSREYFSSLDLLAFEQFYCNPTENISCDRQSKFEQLTLYIKPFCRSYDLTLVQYISDSAVKEVIKQGSLIFVVEYHSQQRHSGLVKNVLDNGCLETLSYHQKFPYKEGLGYDYLCLEEVKNLYLFQGRRQEGVIDTVGNVSYAVDLDH